MRLSITTLEYRGTTATNYNIGAFHDKRDGNCFPIPLLLPVTSAALSINPKFTLDRILSMRKDNYHHDSHLLLNNSRKQRWNEISELLIQ